MIEARDGISTGISTSDRARTISVASAPDARASDLATPGHVLPLEADRDGVLGRAGKTEAAIDLVRLAGRGTSAVLCGIMGDDGEMATGGALTRFAAVHALPCLTVADVVRLRWAIDDVFEVSPAFDAGVKGFRGVRLRERVSGREHLALCLGDLGSDTVLTHVHQGPWFGDVLARARRA